MRMFKTLIICITLIMVLSSCKTVISEKNLRIITKDDYLIEYVSCNGDTILYKEKINLYDAYKNIEIIDITSVKTPLVDMDPVGVDDLGNVYYVNNVDPIINPCPSVIYKYSPYNKEWEKLVETDTKSQCYFVSINNQYLLWLEDESAGGLRLSLHIYNVENQKDIKIYTYTRNPENNLMFTFQFNEPIIIDNKVYFQDTVGIDKDDFYKIKIFSYHISSGKITEIASDSKKVMEYKNEPAWLTMSEDKINCLFYSSFDKDYLFKEITGLGTIYTTKGNMILANDYMTAQDFEKIKASTVETLGNNVISPNSPIECYGIRKYDDDKTIPIIVHGGKGFIDSVKTNGNIVTWCGSSVGVPMFYDNKIDKIVTFEEIIDNETTSYNVLLSNNYIFLRSSVDMVSLDDDKIMLLKINS